MKKKRPQWTTNAILRLLSGTMILCANLLFCTSALRAQHTERDYTIVVKDENGPLAGVRVTERGQMTGGVTDTEGKALLKNIRPGSVFEISFMGYLTDEATAGNQSVIEVVMQPDRIEIDDVVVVGYGVQKKVNLTGSVASVHFNEGMLSRPITSVSATLAGLSAGVQVNQTSGRPGDDNATIRIRGVGTLNSNDPLILVDGIEGPIDGINPQDIESISVLKDAASAAIYGVRGANGVILVTTKKGSKDKFSVTYNGNVSFTQPTRLIDFVSNYADYMELFNEARTNSGSAATYDQETIDLWREKTLDPNGVNALGVPNYIAFPNTDWQNEIFQKSYVRSHSVSVSGGSERTRLFMSAGYLNNPGLVENTGIKRYTLRTNAEMDIKKWLTLGTKIYASQEDYEPGDFDNANSYLYNTNPGVYPRWEGKYGYPEALEENQLANNILERLNNTGGMQRKSRINTTVYSNVRLLPELSWDFSFNYNRRFDEEHKWPLRVGATKFSTGEEMRTPVTLENMTVNTYNFNNYAYTLENVIRYNKTFDKRHDVSALVGYQEYYYQSSWISTQKKGLVDESITIPSAATTMEEIYGNKTDMATRSFFGRVHYAYMSRYLFEANLRYDATSRFHKDHRWGTFPSVSAGWRVSEEEFMKPFQGWLNNLKLRVSYGKLGNNGGTAVGDYDYQSTYELRNYSLNGVEKQGLAAIQLSNTELRWESTTVTNFGLDANLLKNRLSFELDLYRKLTNDILYTPDIYLTAGSRTAPKMNIAEVSNRGVEFTVGWKDNIRKFHYSATANFAYNKNRVTKYKGAYHAGWVDENGTLVYQTNLGDVSTGTTQRLIEGYQINEFYLLQPYSGSGSYFNTDGSVNINGGPRDGMIRTEADMEWVQAMIAAGYKFMPNNTVGKGTLWYGDSIYADVNGDGSYGNANDNVFQNASSTPKYNFGAQISMSYAGFDFYMNWSGATGHKLFWSASGGYNSTSLEHGYGISQRIADDHYFYDPENPNDPRTNLSAKYGRLTNGTAGNQNNTNNTRFLHKGDFFKLKSMAIGYTIPAKYTDKLFIAKARVYVSGDNLLLFTNYPGQDPEIGTWPKYTSVRQFSIGANVTF